MTPHDYCRDKAAPAGSSLYYSLLFLPEDQRRAVTAVHAFYRELVDTVKGSSEAGVARLKLAWWREETSGVYGGRPQHPVSLALAEQVGRYDLPQHRLHEIIDGIQMDLERDLYRDFSALERYCSKVGGTVEILAAEICGYRDRRTLEHAANLGIASQLACIIRDVGEDVRRNRCYLPLDDMKNHGVDFDDLGAAREDESFRRLMELQVERAMEFYRRAAVALPEMDRRSQRAGLIMAAIYRALLGEIRADGCRVLSRRIELTPLRKLWIAWRTWLKA